METTNLNTVNGAVVYWSTGPTQAELLAANLRLLGLEDFIPNPRTDRSALQNAIKDYAKSLGQEKHRDRLIQGHRKPEDGLELVDVDLGESENSYSLAFSAKATETGRVEVIRGNADRYELQSRFDTYKSMLTGASVSKTLVDVLVKLRGTALRPSGGVYWIPERSVEAWTEVAKTVEQCAVEKDDNRIYLLRTIMDHSMVRAVKDAIVNEVSTAAGRIATEIASGELGEDAMETRKVMAGQLRDKVKEYEGILGEMLEGLSSVVDSVEQSALVVALSF